RLIALQVGQAIRDDGPAAHAVKAGTPTMGGTLIIFALLLATLLLADLSDWYVWLAVLVTLGHGLIGFADDWAKVRRRNSRGIPGRVRLLGERALPRRRARRAPHDAVLEGRPPRSRLVVRPLRGARHRRHRQRGEPHRR